MREYIYETQGEQVIGIPKGFILPKEEIVRCRDCKFYKHNSFHRCDLRMQAIEVEPDGFCAWAERKEGGDD